MRLVFSQKITLKNSNQINIPIKQKKILRERASTTLWTHGMFDPQYHHYFYSFFLFLIAKLHSATFDEIKYCTAYVPPNRPCLQHFGSPGQTDGTDFVQAKGDGYLSFYNDCLPLRLTLSFGVDTVVMEPSRIFARMNHFLDGVLFVAWTTFGIPLLSPLSPFTSISSWITPRFTV